MSGAFAWLSDIFGAIIRFFPRLVIVRKTHGGVAFKRGKHIKEIEPGLIFYWPMITELETYPVVRQSLNLPSQTLTTTDGTPITVSCVIIYRIRSIVTALTVQWDLNETIRDLSLAAVKGYVSSHSFDELLGQHGEAEGALTAELRAALRGYGVEILKAAMTDFARTRVVSLVTPGDLRYLPEDEESE